MTSLLALAVLLAAPASPARPAAAPAAPAPAAPAAAPAPRTLVGDAGHGAALFRIHCAACHGVSGEGDGPLARSLKPAPVSLNTTAFLMRRGEEALFKAVSEGGVGVKRSPGMPAFGDELDVLDIWDLVAFLNRARPSMDDYFPEAARYNARVWSLDEAAQKRLEKVAPKLAPEELEVTLATVFKGKKGDEGPVFVADDPRSLDTLKRKSKVGYVAFLDLKLPAVAAKVPVALVLDREGLLRDLRAELKSVPEKERGRLEKLLATFTGQGNKVEPYEPFTPPKATPKEAADAKEVAREVTRVYYRAIEGARAFDKEEADRHWAD